MFDPAGAEWEVVERVCRRLDGLPLAIELAAARMPTMDLDELERRLDERFRLLTRRRGAIERHQSLRMTVGWSYDHLDEGEQLVFDCLSVFTGGFDLDAARAVLGADADRVPVDDVVASLAAKSLLSVQRTASGTRFQQLETLRQFGEERLEQRQRALEVHQLHLDHFLAWSAIANEGLLGPDEVRWHRVYEVEWHNLRNALRWACDSGDADAALQLLANVIVWAAWRMEIEVADWIDLAFAIPGTEVHALRPRMLAFAGLVAGMRGNSHRALELLDRGIADEARLGVVDPFVPVVAGALHGGSGDRQQQIADAVEAQRRGQQWPYVWHVGRAQEAMVRAIILATTQQPTARWDTTIDGIRGIVAEADAFGNPTVLSHALTALGLATSRRDPAAAAASLEQALELAVATDAEYTTAQTRSHLAAAYVQLGRHLDALSLLAPAIRRHIRAGSDGFGWLLVVASLDALAGVGAVDVAGRLLGAVERHGYLPDLLRPHEAVLRDVVDAATLATWRARGDAITLAEAAGAIDETIAGLLEPSARNDQGAAAS